MATSPSRRDRWGMIGARIGLIRRNYKVAPSLYAVGQPSKQSPVLVTANDKLSFDALRHRIEGVDAWLLVLDTRGINVHLHVKTAFSVSYKQSVHFKISQRR